MSEIGTIFREQLREPLTLVWNLLVPVVVFGLINAAPILAGEALAFGVIYPFVGYTVLSFALYSFGIVLVDRRERGFFASITQGRAPTLRYLSFHMAAVWLLMLLALALSLCLSLLVVEGVTIPKLVGVLIGASVGYVSLAVLFAALVVLPITVRSAYSLGSFIIMGCLALSWLTVSLPEENARVLALINPIGLVEALMTPQKFASAILVVLIYLALGLAALVFYPTSPLRKRAV